MSAHDPGRYFYIVNYEGVLKQYDCKTDKVIAEINAGEFSRMDFTQKGIYLRNFEYENDELTITKVDLNLKEIKTLCTIKNAKNEGIKSSDGESLYIYTGIQNSVTGKVDNKKFIKFEFNTESATEISMKEYLDGVYYLECTR